MLSLELGLLFVSLKIVWMTRRQSKVEHFQFWILGSIEFRLNAIARQLAGMGECLYERAGGTQRETAGEGERGESVA